MLPLTRSRRRSRFFGIAIPFEPTLDLSFLSTLDAAVTFARASSATYFDSAGVVQTATSNAPRFDYDPVTLTVRGLLIEESRANLALQSADFATTWSVSGATVSTNAIASPDGGVNADKLAEDATTGSHTLSQNITYSTGAHTASVFAKKAERDWVRVLFYDGTSTFSAFFDLANGVVGNTTGTGTTASIQSVGNGWYRCIVTATATAGAGTFAPRIALANGNSSYAGSAGSGIYLWGAQIEAGSFPTSYIPTTLASATRAADVASVNTLSPWFNAVQGTMALEFSIPAALASRSQVTFGDGTANERIILNSATSLVGTSLRVVDGGSDQCDINLSQSFSLNQIVKVAGAYAVDSFAVSQNGGAVGADNLGTLPTVTTLYLGSNGVGTYASSHLRRFTYWNQRMSNPQLRLAST